ncbi:MAG TPA: prolyl oligopeptidase family serine peptidase [Thermoanaerobaculia bacterium]|nr:prolyl oligopeptidase family serine peptidase [Thermoanaerobaculia bacterium]
MLAMPRVGARLRALTLVLLAAWIAPARLRAAALPFTLDAVLDFPYASEVVAARRAPRIAWQVNEHGERSLWTAAAPDFASQRLAAWPDDGQPLSGLALSDDGATLVFVRGGFANAAGDRPNPTSDPGGAEQAVWVVPTTGGPPRKLAVGSSPDLAPAGDRIAFLDKGVIREVDVSAPPAAPVASTAGSRDLVHARGSLGSPRWSPDGRRLVFTSDRGDHSFVGVWDRGSGTITWMAPSADRDVAPVWSPDGRRVAFVRLPGLRDGELPDVTSANPFAVWVADAASGEGRQLWVSGPEAGGRAQWDPDQPLLWAGDERLVFASAESGRLHWYALPAAGGAPVDLTPGECESEHVAIAAGGATLYFDANCGDVDRRHPFRVPTAGGRAEALTRGDGIETEPLPLAGGRWLALRAASARAPQAAALLDLEQRGGAPRRLAPELPASFPGDRFVAPRQVIFHAADGLELHGQLFVPAGAAPGAGRPAVIFLHGGPMRQMLLGFHYGGYYANAYAMNQYLASRGFVVLSVNYRSGIGSGEAFRRAGAQGPRGASEYQDVLAAGAFLRQQPGVDGHRIGLWGGSYGGYLTALALARDSARFAAGVDLHGVHDWGWLAKLENGADWGLLESEWNLAHTSSPVADVATWTSPVLFIHGDDDRNVRFSETTDLVQRLRAQKVPVELLVFPDEAHSFLRGASWKRAYEATADFFVRRLMAAPP